ncbi:MAG: hypothetical protein WC508_00565 [Patescibacteria group bacterium]
MIKTVEKIIDTLVSGLVKSKKDILSRKWFLFLVLALFIVLFLSFGFDLALVLVLILIFWFYQWDSRILLFPAGIFLAVGLISMVYQQDDLARLAASYIYYFFLAVGVLQIQKLKEPREKFLKANDQIDDLLIPLANQANLAKRTKKMFWSYNQDGLLISGVNILIICGYLLFFGANWPNQQNYYQFIVLLLILLIVNSYLFFEKQDSKTKWLSKKAILKFFENRNNVLLLLINVSIISIYLLLFGFTWPRSGNYGRFLGLGFFLLVINVIALLDISNEDKKYD